MKAVVDASVLGGILFRDDHWQTLKAWLEANVDTPILNEFAWGELVSAVGARVRRGAIASADATTLLEAYSESISGWERLPIEASDVRRATELVARFDLALRLPDAIHIAIAERIGTALITADRQQHRAAGTLGLDTFNPLEEGPAAT